MSNMPTSKTTLELCRLAHRIQLRGQPDRILKTAKNLLRDGLGVALAGMDHPTIRLLSRQVRSLGVLSSNTNTNNGTAGSPVWGQGYSTFPIQACLVNGSAMHVLDFEPMALAPTHPVAPVLSGLLALVHSTSLTNGLDEEAGERFMHAFLAGIQLQVSLRKAASPPHALNPHQQDDMEDDTTNDTSTNNYFPFHKQGFYPPGVVGPLGSALAASIWLELDDKTTAMALGMAASGSGGLAGNIGTMTKALHCGQAARMGLECALLAQQGFTASAETLEGPVGWGHVFGGDSFDLPTVLWGMESLDCFTESGFAFKKWPAHTAMQVAIDAAMPLYHQEYVPQRKVTIVAPVLPYCDRPFPKDTNEARFSFQYNVALAILDGHVDFDSYTLDRLHAVDMQALLGRIELVLDPSLPSNLHAMQVQVHMDDGRFHASNRWPGHWKSPATDKMLMEKFVHCASRMYSEKVVQGLARSVDKITNAKDLHRLAALLRLPAKVRRTQQDQPWPIQPTKPLFEDNPQLACFQFP